VTTPTRVSTAATDGAQHERRESPEAISHPADRLGALARWLRCPRCEAGLAPGDGAWSLRCSTGHSFDANKRGYLNLVDRGRGIFGDSKEILEARDRFLRAGHYSPIVGLLHELLGGASEPASILDSGCGTGYYLQDLLRSRPGWDALVLDVSADAVALASRATGAPGVVSDVWRPLPVLSARADVVLCVFSPRNPAEFARVLRPDGTLLVVTPRENHLVQLRDRGRLIGIHPDKLTHLDESLEAFFRLADRRPLEYDVAMTSSEQADLGAMGPSGHHPGLSVPAEDHDAATTVTVAVDVSVYRLR
jgi:23S rRNA (guanine745-N1)-methyltransferase